MNKIIRVLVVDDSAYVRKVIKKMLSRSPFIEVVGTAHDGLEALEKVEQLKPDVITLDLIMPGMDGKEFIREQMTKNPLPIVVVSIADQGGEKVLNALDAGAIDFIQKPTALAIDRILDISDELINKVKEAAKIPLKKIPLKPPQLQPDFPKISLPFQAKNIDIVALGISTGGPQALTYLIPQLPLDFPVPLVVVLHMPVGYTKMFAERLDKISAVRVVEAEEGDLICPGVVTIAQAGRHLVLERQSNDSVIVHLDAQPLDTLHRPSVDVMFQSVADIYGERVLGVVMTGMGEDGKQGAAWIKARGGSIITEAESSCIVYGMPRAVVEAGLSDQSVPLEKMAQTIQSMVNS
jgi:two-component system chemotaxis response regulator CheB